MYLDALHLRMRLDGLVQTRAVYLALGVNLEGRKELLGLWIGENEGSKFWLSILTQLRNRGVRDILVACVDGLTGFPEAIESASRWWGTGLDRKPLEVDLVAESAIGDCLLVGEVKWASPREVRRLEHELANKGSSVTARSSPRSGLQPRRRTRKSPE